MHFEGDKVKTQILNLLKQKGDYISGAEISRRLGVSRAAVWKHIEALRRDGYVIEAAPRLGYRFVEAPDLLLPAEVQAALRTRVFGRYYHYLEETGSTNDVARELAAQGAPEGTLVVAERQAKGRGRMGRSWSSPAGGLWFSLVLRPAIHPSGVAGANFLAGVACAEALSSLPGVRPRIKWPNDILLQDRKVGGILLELSAEADRVNHLVLGIGINVNVDLDDFPASLRSNSSSLAAHLGRRVSRLDVLASVLEALEEWYNRWLREGFAPVIAAWREWQESLGKQVRVIDAQGEWLGTAIDVDDHGALLVERAPGMVRRVLSGDIFAEIAQPQEG